MITIVGLGPATLDQLPPAARAVLESATTLLLRTSRHPAADELRAAGIAFESLDAEYERAPSFDALYERLAEVVLERHASGDVVFAVPGHPLFAEESVRRLLAAARAHGIPARVVPAPSFADAGAAALASAGVEVDFTQLQMVDSAALAHLWWDATRPALLHQVDDVPTASRVKLVLMEEYPDEHPVFIVRHAGVPAEEEVRSLPLLAVDRPEAGAYDHLCTLYVPPLAPETRRPQFQDFVDIIARLRGPDGCPWDREQDFQTLKRFVLEEAYEVLEAVDSGDPARLCDELGDLMIQVLMYAQFAREDGRFDIRDVIANTVDKLIRRHPHVFGDVRVGSAAEVLRNWEAIKRRERPERESVLDGVPQALPALMLAREVSRRVVKVGFEWPSLADVVAKLQEEVDELRRELPQEDAERLRAEIGDLLFTVVNVARWLKVDPEDALRTMVARFSERFREVERLAAQEGRSLQGMTIAELDALWDEAKRRLEEKA
ncbi:MAG: nucleoside triphosphate pyrophosphohydrolase [Armatimonadetes bacterium]|nr:nucleoside triphosphate pyrophosphohydrolase [Armatimonadota bacterium]